MWTQYLKQMKKPNSVSVTIIRTHNFTAKLIHVGMWVYAALRGKKITKSYNHSEVRFGNMTSGAIAKGVSTREWQGYVDSIKRIKWIDYPLTLTTSQWKKGYEYLQKAEGTKYEYSNFWNHAIHIFTGKWKGRTTDKKLYCYEHVIRFLNATGKYYLDPVTNPYEFKVWADKNLVNQSQSKNKL